MSKIDYMKLAIDEAWKYQFLTYPNPAVGAVVVKNDVLLSVSAHQKAGLPHAEVLALKEAYLKEYPNSELNQLEDSLEIHNYLKKNHHNFFLDCEIYVTLEPCNHTGKTPPCASLLEDISIKKVYIGTLDPNENASGGKNRLEKVNIDVEVGICKEKTDELLNPFIKYQQSNLLFFKMAMREDGSIDGGYITSQDSLNLVHELRTKIDLMVIGGNTIRIDKPKLDSRFSKSKKSPDIFIYSKSKDFDKSIPLFDVKNREVTIGSNLEILKNKKFVMIEGGYSLFENIKNYLDYLLVFISHKDTKDNKFDLKQLGFKKIHSFYINKYDELVVLKKFKNLN